MEGEERSSHGGDGLVGAVEISSYPANVIRNSAASMLHDEAGAALARAVGPDPLHKYADTKT
jgi:hypothetical protein